MIPLTPLTSALAEQQCRKQIPRTGSGICSEYTIDSDGNSPCTTGSCYTSWYLPAICEMGATGEGAGCSPGIQNIVTNLPALISGCSGSSCLSGDFWSSTEYMSFPSERVWFETFNSSFNSQYREAKDNTYSVRCARALIP